MTNKYNTEENQKLFKQFTFWAKFFAILGYISGGFTILVGVPMLLFFGLGVVYIVLGLINIYISTKLWGAASKTKDITDIDSDSDFTDKLIQSFGFLKSYFRISGILTVVSIVASILLVVVFIIIGLAAPNTFDYNVDDSTIYDSSSIQDRLQEQLDELDSLDTDQPL